jgi:hypothetical protein
LLPLADLDAEFVSLQKEVRGDDATALKERGDILHFGDELNTFADAAAVIANLDLVISVDTSVAHLRGYWQNRLGSCCLFSQTFAGCSIARIVPGIRPRGLR